MQKFLLYLPYSDFIDYYEHKALGAIPIGFVQAGFDVSLIVGVMRSANYRKNKIRIYETGNLDDRYVKTDASSGMAIKPRLLNFFNISEYKRVLKILKKENPGILMAYNNSTLTWLIMWRYKIYCRTRKVKTRLILKLDNDGSDLIGMNGIRKIAIRSYYRVLSHIFNDIITETSCGYEVFHNLPGVKKKLRVVPNTVFDDFLKHNNKERDKTIIAVSRITPVKGLDILIKSFKLIAERYPDWNLKIIGAVGDVEYFSSLKETSGPSFLGKRIVFTGEKTREELIDIYGKASIYCLFSEHESFAISRLEAIAMGLYVITTPAGCANDLIKYGVHIIEDNTPECGSKYIEEGIKAIESGFFKENIIKIPSYKDIAGEIADNTVRVG
ncbi:MAG: glycosyltransferase family 4 protein [Ferroplasma sp.]|uniref:glycosyltransferase family 4 protein n=1 Tax=Ferroplasma sp. TaxID=2591003 RepID=UPI002815630A|nr:glycosyltransferase family 4 protein [Ferroplasma sp.]WMT50612.1 MAG: glycosyltransferase family 4 protein [Ferroplasma sp.]